ncbi:MAG: GNAT family N-acetyltransferase [Verrucomicrobiales bacterium]|nr:GNAT family N-acetyltransferase [Verrucomicrobiales bacterium]
MTAERTVTLLDGTPATVRTIRPSDGEALQNSLNDLDSDSRIRRFFFDKRQLSDSELARLANPDGVNHIAFGVAVNQADNEEPTPIGVGRCIRDERDKELAEVAVVTADLWHSVGVGTEIMKSLAFAAVEVGIRRFFASTFSDNIAVVKLLNKIGVELESRSLGSGVIEVVYELTVVPENHRRS